MIVVIDSLTSTWHSRLCHFFKNFFWNSSKFRTNCIILTFMWRLRLCHLLWNFLWNSSKFRTNFYRFSVWESKMALFCYFFPVFISNMEVHFSEFLNVIWTPYVCSVLVLYLLGFAIAYEPSNAAQINSKTRKNEGKRGKRSEKIFNEREVLRKGWLTFEKRVDSWENIFPFFSCIYFIGFKKVIWLSKK